MIVEFNVSDIEYNVSKGEFYNSEGRVIATFYSDGVEFSETCYHFEDDKNDYKFVTTTGVGTVLKTVPKGQEEITCYVNGVMIHDSLIPNNVLCLWLEEEL